MKQPTILLVVTIAVFLVGYATAQGSPITFASFGSANTIGRLRDTSASFRYPLNGGRWLQVDIHRNDQPFSLLILQSDVNPLYKGCSSRSNDFDPDDVSTTLRPSGNTFEYFTVYINAIPLRGVSPFFNGTMVYSFIQQDLNSTRAICGSGGSSNTTSLSGSFSEWDGSRWDILPATITNSGVRNGASFDFTSSTVNIDGAGELFAVGLTQASSRSLKNN